MWGVLSCISFLWLLLNRFQQTVFSLPKANIFKTTMFVTKVYTWSKINGLYTKCTKSLFTIRCFIWFSSVHICRRNFNLAQLAEDLASWGKIGCIPGKAKSWRTHLLLFPASTWDKLWHNATFIILLFAVSCLHAKINVWHLALLWNQCKMRKMQI